MIGLFPSLNDIFENSLGQFIVTSSPLWNYANIIKAFKHGKKDATQTALVVEAPDIPMDYVMSMFNIRNVREQLVDINESPEYHDFHVEMDGFCTQTGDSTDNNTNFERDLFSMCLAKYCIGHFAWVSISSAVAMSLI
jgi:hypothetical protein